MKPRLTYFVSHPIQYQAPLLRWISRDPSIDFQVIFENKSNRECQNIDFLEQQAKYLIYLFFYKKNTNIKNLEKYKNQKIIDYFFNEKKHNKYFLL